MFSYTYNIEEAWNVFENTVVTAMAKFVPKSFICKRVKCVTKYIEIEIEIEIEIYLHYKQQQCRNKLMH